MKNKSSLVLMELLVMVLVFAFSAALCLSLFAASHRISRETLYREEGARLAQNAAELLKNGESLSQLDPGDYTLTIEEVPSPAPGWLKQVRILVAYGQETVFTLETGWQEAAP